MECKPARLIASSFANNMSIGATSFAVIVSRKVRRLRARPVSNASRYGYRNFSSFWRFPTVIRFYPEQIH